MVNAYLTFVSIILAAALFVGVYIGEWGEQVDSVAEDLSKKIKTTLRGGNSVMTTTSNNGTALSDIMGNNNNNNNNSSAAAAQKDSPFPVLVDGGVLPKDNDDDSKKKQVPVVNKSGPSVNNNNNIETTQKSKSVESTQSDNSHALVGDGTLPKDDSKPTTAATKQQHASIAPPKKSAEDDEKKTTTSSDGEKASNVTQSSKSSTLPKDDSKPPVAPVLKKQTTIAPPSKIPEELMLDFFSSKTCQPESTTKNATTFEPWLNQMLIQIGVQKGGTKAMHTFLEEHPHFASRCAKGHSTFELNYFNFGLIDKKKNDVLNQHELRKGYETLIKDSCPAAVNELKQHDKMMYMDDSPLYMQDSDTIPQFLNCAMPQAKILAILRNPIDRAFSHYNFYLQKEWCTDKTFDEWVDANLEDLNKAGVPASQDNPYHELLTWQQYNTRTDRKCRTFVSRGLYAIQLLHYTMGLKAAGRSVESNLKVVHSADLKGEERQHVYNGVLDFLGMEPHTLQIGASVHKTVYQKEMLPSTRAKLEEFYKPYNQRLYELLQWDPVWD